MNKQIFKVLVLCVAACGCKQSGSSANVVTPGAGGTTAVGTGGVAVVGTGGAVGMNAAGTGGQGAAGIGLPGTGGTSVVGPVDAGVDPNSFSAVYKDIIVGVGCNGGALCHGGMVGNLTMTTKDQAYAALVGVPAMGMNLVTTMNKTMDCKDSGLTRVVPFMPEASLLMLKVERMPPCGDPMPVTPLAPEKVEQIRAWITSGALNN